MGRNDETNAGDILSRLSLERISDPTMSPTRIGMVPFCSALISLNAVLDRAHHQGIDLPRTTHTFPDQNTELPRVGFSRSTFNDCMFRERTTLDQSHLMT